MVSCVKCEKRDSVLGNHSGDFVDFRTTADSCSALKSTKSTTSTTAKRSFFRKQATAVQGGGTQAGFFRIPRILEEEKQAENKKTTDIQKVDSSKQAHFLSLRALRGKAWQSIQTKTQSLESTFDNPTTAKTHKVDSRIFHNTAIFATAKKWIATILLTQNLAMTEIVFLIPRRKMKKQKSCLIKSRRRKDFLKKHRLTPSGITCFQGVGEGIYLEW